MELDIIELILNDFVTTSEEQQRIKFFLETHKSNCSNYINNSSKYKERVICLKSIYHSIKTDLLRDISEEINK